MNFIFGNKILPGYHKAACRPCPFSTVVRIGCPASGLCYAGISPAAFASLKNLSHFVYNDLNDIIRRTKPLNGDIY